jgi:hypothetical protein
LGFSLSIHPLTFNGAWLTDQAEAHVVLAQVAPPSKAILDADASRPWVVQTLQGLLGGERRLAQIVTANRPAILLLPELALGLEDWAAIDALVRAWQHPLIVISGFGFSRGDRITAWLGEAGSTARHAGWPVGEGPAAGRLYNAGWCWVHRPGATACIVFLKSTAEQYDEVHIDGLDHGTAHVAICLDDLLIFPVICSDLLNIVDGQRVVARKIARYLEDQGNGGPRVLIAGLLLQKSGHTKWRTAVIDVANAINTERVNICLVNSAHDMCSMAEEADRWRDYSGAFIANGRHAFNGQFSAVRRFSTEQLDAAVIRHTSPAVLGGPLRWSFNGATGRHLWAVQMDYGIGAEGPLVASPCQDRYRFETLRVLRRLTDAHDAPEAYKADVVRASYGVIRTQIETHAEPVAEVICQKTLFGEPGQEARDRLDADSLSSYLPQAAIGFKVLGALQPLGTVAWQADLKQKGQLHIPAHTTNLLVWCYPDSAIRMGQTLRRWRAELPSAPPLVVFKKATGVHLAAPNETSKRRDDVGEAPAPMRRGADTPRTSALIVERNLEDLEACFEHDTMPAFTIAVQAQLTAALQALDAAGGLHAV